MATATYKCANPERTKTDGANSQSKSYFFFSKVKIFRNPFCKKKLEIINNMIQKNWGGCHHLLLNSL